MSVTLIIFFTEANKQKLYDDYDCFPFLRSIYTISATWIPVVAGLVSVVILGIAVTVFYKKCDKACVRQLVSSRYLVCDSIIGCNFLFLFLVLAREESFDTLLQALNLRFLFLFC